jgi:riboflavin transporter FmnP
MNNRNIERTKRLVIIAMFSALAYVTTVICKLIPDVAGFLSLEVKDAVIVLCSLMFGPISGLIIAVLVPLVELFTISATGWYGLVMNVLSSATFALVVGALYKHKRTLKGAIIALVSGVFSVTAVMMLANLFITPLYLKYMVGVPSASMGYVAGMIPTILLPFNLTKAVLNMALVLLFYKPFTRVLRKMGLMANSKNENNDNKRSWLIYIGLAAISILIITVSLLIIFVALK